MTVTERDAWADARTAATEPFLEGEVAAVRRRLWLRRAGRSVLVSVVVLGLFFGLDALLGFSADELWHVPLPVALVGFGIVLVGFVVVCAGGVRSSYHGTDRAFVRPEHFLPHADRSWLRQQIADGRQVPEERRAVLADAARRLVAERSSVWTYVGSLLSYVGIVIATPFPVTVLAFSGLAVFMVVQTVRAVVWAGRAQRWLAHYACLSDDRSRS